MQQLEAGDQSPTLQQVLLEEGLSNTQPWLLPSLLASQKSSSPRTFGKLSS